MSAPDVKPINYMGTIERTMFDAKVSETYETGPTCVVEVKEKFCRLVEDVMEQRGFADELQRPIYVEVWEWYKFTEEAARECKERYGKDELPSLPRKASITGNDDLHVITFSKWALERMDEELKRGVIAHELCHALERERYGKTRENGDRFQALLEEYGASVRLRDHRDPEQFHEGHP